MLAFNTWLDISTRAPSKKSVVNSYPNLRLIQIKSGIFQDPLKFKLKASGNTFRNLEISTDRPFDISCSGQPWAFEISNIVTFYWVTGSSDISYLPLSGFTESIFQYQLLHTALPIYLTIEKKFHILHAGSVEIEGKSVLFSAPSYGGKSTLTNYFVRQGHTLFSDDKVATNEIAGNFWAYSSYPWHRPYRKPEDLGIFAENFSTTPKPIHAVYLLLPGNPATKVQINQTTGQDCFESLFFANDVNFHFLKKPHFKYIAKMADSVRVYKVSVPWDIDRLPDVYEGIVRHSRSLPPLLR